MLLLRTGTLSPEGGEVVVLRTEDPAYRIRETRLWVVEWGGRLWVRANSPKVVWYGHIVRNPNVTLYRGGTGKKYRARAAPDDRVVRDRINELMATKYGWYDALASLFLRRSGSVPVRLEPS